MRILDRKKQTIGRRTPRPIACAKIASRQSDLALALQAQQHSANDKQQPARRLRNVASHTTECSRTIDSRGDRHCSPRKIPSGCSLLPSNARQLGMTCHKLDVVTPASTDITADIRLKWLCISRIDIIQGSCNLRCGCCSDHMRTSRRLAGVNCIHVNIISRVAVLILGYHPVENIS